MNYENAADILPEDLLKRVQKFAAGKLIYVPETTEKRPWGETSGYKRYLAERNQEIKEKFISGSTIENLADEYNPFFRINQENCLHQKRKQGTKIQVFFIVDKGICRSG